MKSRIQSRTTFQGLPINVEIEVGQTRRGIDENGQEWQHTYDLRYGEIDGTVGADGDAVDVYLGKNRKAENVYVVKQVRADRETYDEDKVFLGFDSAVQAQKAYFDHGPSWGYGRMERHSLEEFCDVYLRNRARPPITSNDRTRMGDMRYGKSS